MRRAPKRRIDQLIVERGLAESRQRAQALLLAGQVLVNEQRIEKPGHRVSPESVIRIIGELPYASRAGAKLAAALDHFGVSVSGRICADLGASTGGFTDCLLQRGAHSVHAYDVGRGQLAWKLRTDSRVIVRDEFNVRDVRAADLPAGISFVSGDLSFISLTKILGPLKNALLERMGHSKNAVASEPIHLILLVKPQFEVGQGEVGKGGIVREAAKRDRALLGVEEYARNDGFRSIGSIPSPITGTKGNQEFLLYLQLWPGLSFPA